MRSIIIFDSVHGCTKQIAEAIADEFKTKGYEVSLYDLGKSKPKLVDCDYLFLGSPTRFGKPTRRMRKFLDAFDGSNFSGTAVAFDTIMQIPENSSNAEETKLKYIDNGSAPTIKSILSQKGVNVSDKLLRIEVSGLKGPLVNDALNNTKEFVDAILSH